MEEYKKVIEDVKERMKFIQDYLDDQEGEIKIMTEDVDAMVARIKHIIDWKKSKNEEQDGEVIKEEQSDDTST